MPRQRVDLREVTGIAVAIIDRESLAALSLSAVAGELGVRPSALYTYFENVEALRYAVAVQAITNLTDNLRNAAVGRAGDDAIVALAHTYRTFAVDHPGQYEATLVPPRSASDALAEVSNELTALFARVIANYGHEGDRAVHAAHAARAAIHGFVTLEIYQGLSHHDDADADASFAHLVTTVINGLT